MVALRGECIFFCLSDFSGVVAWCDDIVWCGGMVWCGECAFFVFLIFLISHSFWCGERFIAFLTCLVWRWQLYSRLHGYETGGHQGLVESIRQEM